MSLPHDSDLHRSSGTPESSPQPSTVATKPLSSSDSTPNSVASGEATSPAAVSVAQERSSNTGTIDWLHSPRKSSGFSRSFIWLMLIASLGLHAILLWFPIPAEKKPANIKPEEKSVRITQLPTLTKTAAVKPIPKSPLVKKPTVIQRRSLPQASRPLVQPAKPPAPAQDPKSEVSSNPWQDFPQYPGAEAGCFNLPSCQQTGDGLNQVGTFFEKEVVAKKYSLAAVRNEADRKVYRISRNNLTQFLNILVVEGKGTVYVLAPAELTLADLAKAKVVPPEIAAVFEGLDAEDVSRDRLAQPDAFYTGDKPRSEIIDMRLIANPSPDITAETFFDAYLSTNLRNSSFDDYSETGQRYGGGPVYLAKKGKTSLYINTVPTQDGSGTVVVIWKTLPK